MSAPFGDHTLKIPYEPVADLLAKYRASAIRTRPPSSIWIPARRSISVELDQVAIDIAAYLKGRGIKKGRPHPAAVRRQPGNAPDLARRLATWRRGLSI